MNGHGSQYLNFLINEDNGEHENALFFHFSRNGNQIMEEQKPTELEYPFNDLYQHIIDIKDNADLLKEGLNGYLLAGKSKRLKHEKLVNMRRAIEAILGLANGMECRFNTIEWPNYKHPLPPHDKNEKPILLTNFPSRVKCGEAASKSITDKEMV